MPNVGAKKYQMRDPGAGWEPTGRNNKEGESEWVYVGLSQMKDTSKPSGTSSGTAPGSRANSGSSGSSGNANPGLSQYIQDYRIKFRPGAKPPPNILKKAEAGNWSLAYFEQQIRLHDPSYWRSIEAKSMLPSFNRTMKVLFPGLADKLRQRALMKSPFYKKTAMWYLKNGVGLRKNGEEILYSHITNTRRWNRQNPYWRAYAKNRNIGVASEANPMLYKSFLTAMQENFQAIGLELPEDYYRTFFRSRYASESGFKDMQDNLKRIAEGRGAQEWWQGKTMDTGQIKTAALEAGAAGTELRARLQRSLGVERSFLGGEQQPFGSTLSKQGKLIRPLI